MTPGLALVLKIFLFIYGVPVLLNAVKLILTQRPLLLREDQSRLGLVPPPSDPMARVRILFTRGRKWRAVFGGHSFIVLKPRGAAAYVRYDWDDRGEPIRNEGFVAQDSSSGSPPGFIYAADGWLAEQLIPAIEAAIGAYATRHVHDYRRFPGPNSNTFVQGVIDGTPGLDAVLSPLAIGKDYPHDGRLVRRLQSGVLISFGGYVGVRVGWIEGFELSLCGLVLGVDWRRPAIKLPSIGRIGLAACAAPPAVAGSGRVMRAEQLAEREQRLAAGGRRGGRQGGGFGAGPGALGGRRMRR
jgi:hypothetical protein